MGIAADFFILRQILALERQMTTPNVTRIDEILVLMDRNWDLLTPSERRLADQVEQTYHPDERYNIRRDEA